MVSDMCLRVRVIAPVIAPPAFGSAAPAVVVVLVKIASLVAISTPSKVELVVIAPVIAPPAFGSAASAVAVLAVISVALPLVMPVLYLVQLLRCRLSTRCMFCLSCPRQQ